MLSKFVGCFHFSGKPRKNSVSLWLKKLSKHLGTAVEIGGHKGQTFFGVETVEHSSVC